jgi:hypothetical protein
MWIKDPKTGEKSVSLTLLVAGFVTLLGKVLLSGVVIADANLGTMSASDFAMAISPLAALYWGRRKDSKEEESK